MQENTQQFLEAATPDELLSCIQLLAMSVVQHRAKCGFVTLRKSTEQLLTTADETGTAGLFVQSKEVVEEALEMVRTLAAAPASTVTPADSKPSDNRTQFRIKISLPIKVLWPQDPKPVNAKLEDISWGGASIHVDDARVNSGDTLRIVLPRPQGGSIAIEAKILRTWDHPNGNGHGIATRFSTLSTRDEAKLEDILEHLAKSADEGGQRNHARLSQRLDIQFDTDQELLSTLNDISAGGLGITVPDPVQIGQSLQIVISTLDESCCLRLRARVVRQEPLKLRSTEVYRLGLKFEHPTEELKKRTTELISKMAAMKNK
ncbi:MAG TPA: PilZ domain-containing protein [Halioglobus sp.]